MEFKLPNNSREDEKLKIGENVLSVGISGKRGKDRRKVKNDGTVEKTGCENRMVQFNRDHIAVYVDD